MVGAWYQHVEQQCFVCVRSEGGPGGKANGTREQQSCHGNGSITMTVFCPKTAEIEVQRVGSRLESSHTFTSVPKTTADIPLV
jgi:hypothetical protein